MVPTRTHRASRLPGRRAFTLIELMVSIALLVAVILMVSQIFSITSEAAGITTAQSEVFSAAAAFREHMTKLLSKIEPGLLIIESPPLTAARFETPGGERFYRQRHDRIVFVASGGLGEFQSTTDPTRGMPVPMGTLNENSTPATSSQALILVGPGITRLYGGLPIENTFLGDATVPASEWILAQRTILLGIDPQSSDFPNGPFVANTPTIDAAFLVDGANQVRPLHQSFRDVDFDAVRPVNYVAGPAANAATLIGRLAGVGVTTGNPTPAASVFSPLLWGLWQMNYTPPTASGANVNLPDHYSRNGFNFLEHVADFRIEWTDGRAINAGGQFGNPVDIRTRWFGLRPDPDATPSAGGVDTLPQRSALRANFPASTTLAEAAVFGIPGGAGSRVEAWSTGANARYRAVWRNDTWEFRPKALRFTFRVYDSHNRLARQSPLDLDEDGIDDDSENASLPSVVKRYGQEFSIVIPLS